MNQNNRIHHRPSKDLAQDAEQVPIKANSLTDNKGTVSLIVNKTTKQIKMTNLTSKKIYKTIKVKGLGNLAQKTHNFQSLVNNLPKLKQNAKNKIKMTGAWRKECVSKRRKSLFKK
jgi:PBP1b-binding outer membrane lipoprotein LpoB